MSDSNDQTHQGWGYADWTLSGANTYSGQAYQYVRWSGTCEKKIRRNRR